jgi:ribonucleoside-diphosphate reductase alpha chain
LPHDGGSYRQAPYEEITEDLYNLMLPSIPKSLDWDSLVEMEDNVEGVQTLACTSGSCEI